MDLDVSTILAEQIKDPVLGSVRSWIRKQISPDVKSPEIQQSKGLIRYCPQLDRHIIETEGQLRCYKEPSDKLDKENFRICLPLSFFLACFRLRLYNELGGHLGANKTTPMLKDSIIGLEGLTGFALLQPIVSFVKTTNPNQNTATKFL